ncbi:hypothetical protein ACDA63_10035 [Uliginosibacterium sp. sgz301328]|uniref:hypothetical protein n=1 Tax=Uliginosibacterium sp. sgz301328 TaxID=3243764 RepID=UPI00359E9DC5
MTNDISNQLLDDFANAEHPDARVQALTDLMTHKVIPKQAADARFEKGLECWVLLATQADTVPSVRLVAIAELVRATQQLKKRQPDLLKRLQTSMGVPFSPLNELTDPEDRLNVARACTFLTADWLKPYLAASIAAEQGAKVRSELMAGLVTRSSSIADVLEHLISAFDALQLETETPADSRARRLTATLEAFRTTVLGALLDAGDEVGGKLNSWLVTTFSKTGRPQEESAQLALTREVALALHDLVRSRFSISTEPQTFQALKYCRGFFTGISWPAAVRNETDLLVQDVSEALVLLGRMGIPNQALLERLELVCGIKERARAVASSLAEKHTELSEEIRSWLRLGRTVNTVAASDVLQETLLDASDEALGLALIESRELLRQGESIRKLVLTSLQILDPSMASVLHDYLSQAGNAGAALEELAKRRGLDLYGKAGDDIPFAPKYFDAIGSIRGTQVTIVRPAIVRSTSDNTVGQVVKKGLVE